jgi:aromatic ring hydroxylase
LRPTEQVDPDLYVHVVEEKPEGIVVRGAKMHTGYASLDQESSSSPARRFRKGEENYAVAFAVPANTRV